MSSDIDEPYVDIDREVGVGPHPLPWPTEAHFDVELLASGDRRNVIDRYRYWTMEAIIADLDTRRHGFHIAIENFKHDMNIGTVVRNANAFMAAEVHIVGRRRWNRRGAMVTDRYQHVRHHPDVPLFAVWAADNDLPIIGIDNVEGSVPLETARLPTRCVLLMGQEGAGLSDRRLPNDYEVEVMTGKRLASAGSTSHRAPSCRRSRGDCSPRRCPRRSRRRATSVVVGSAKRNACSGNSQGTPTAFGSSYMPSETAGTHRTSCKRSEIVAAVPDVVSPVSSAS